MRESAAPDEGLSPCHQQQQPLQQQQQQRRRQQASHGDEAHGFSNIAKQLSCSSKRTPLWFTAADSPTNGTSVGDGHVRPQSGAPPASDCAAADDAVTAGTNSDAPHRLPSDCARKRDHSFACRSTRARSRSRSKSHGRALGAGTLRQEEARRSWSRGSSGSSHLRKKRKTKRRRPSPPSSSSSATPRRGRPGRPSCANRAAGRAKLASSTAATRGFDAQALDPSAARERVAPLRCADPPVAGPASTDPRLADELMLRAAQIKAAQRLAGVPCGAAPMREGDWLCPTCNAHNYRTKQRCFRCFVGTRPLR